MKGNGFTRPLIHTVSKRSLDHFNTYIKGSPVVKIPVEQYLKEKIDNAHKNKV
jgi:hypothetical protein